MTDAAASSTLLGAIETVLQKAALANKSVFDAVAPNEHTRVVAFLRAVCVDFPHSRGIWAMLPQDPTAAPFHSESEFITVKHVDFLLRWWHGAVALRADAFVLSSVRDAFASSDTCTLNPPTKEQQEPQPQQLGYAAVGLRSQYLTVVQQAIDDMHKMFHGWYIAGRLSATPRLKHPRVLRLAAALLLTPHETEALVFLLVQHCSAQRLPVGHDREFQATLHSMQRMAGMSARELLAFCSPARLHVKQGVFVVPERWAPADYSWVQMPQVVVAALSGAVPLSQEEAVKLEKTTLCDLLLDDGNCLPAGIQMERSDTDKASKTAAAAAAAAAALTAETAASSPAVAHNDKSKKDNGAKTSNNANNGKKHNRRAGGKQSPGVVDKKQSPRLPQRRSRTKSSGFDDDDDNGARGGGGDSDGESSFSSSASSSSGASSGSDADHAVGDDDDDETKSKQKAEKQQQQQQQQERDSATRIAAATAAAEEDNKNAQAYKEGDDLLYLEHMFERISLLIKMRNTESDTKDDEASSMYSSGQQKSKADAQLREFRSKERLQRAKVEARLHATRQAAAAAAAEGRPVWLPRVEVLAERLQLSEFEKLVLLLVAGNVVSHDIAVAINGRWVGREGAAMNLSVGYVLFVLAEGLSNRIAARRTFTREAPLVKNNIISINPPDNRTGYNCDIVECTVDVDRTVVDMIIGNTIAPSELVQNSKLFEPQTSLDDVVLSADVKRTIERCISSHHNFSKLMKSDVFSRGGSSSTSALSTASSSSSSSTSSTPSLMTAANTTGLTLLLYGASGTGKTLAAAAIAHTLKQKLLVVNALSVKQAPNPGEVIRYLMRESTLHRAVVFFDECESLFENRLTNPILTSVLSEFERFQGVVILATNRAAALDEAMSRRISVVIEFKLPDHNMRLKIYEKHLPHPSVIPLAPDVNLPQIAMDFCLSGGLIKNAVLAAVRNAVSREGTDRPSALTRQDLEDGARSQLRGLFQVSEVTTGQQPAANRIQTPQRTLSDVVLDGAMRERLQQLVRKIKSRAVLFSQWGFKETEVEGEGSVVALLCGRSGNGKTLCAEAVARECGLNIRCANLAAMLLKGEKDVVAELQAIFDEASALGLMIVFDGAEELFSSTSSLSDVAGHTASLLQYHIANGKFSKPILFLASTGGGSGVGAGGATRIGEATLDLSSCGVRFSDVVQLSMPSKELRAQMFRSFIPEAVPIAPESPIDFDKLAESSSLSPKAIRIVCFNAVSMAAMSLQQQLTMELIQRAVREYIDADNKRRPQSSMFM